MSRITGNAFWIAVCAFFLLAPEARAYRASDFHWLPPFLAMEEKPSLTFILDTSSSMLERAYSAPFNATREYYGYFDPHSSYSYNAESDMPHFFADNATGEWNGNFLNWAAMLRIDVARKVLTGGKFDPPSNCYELELLSNITEEFVFDDSTPRRDLEDRLSHMTPLQGAFTIKARDDDGFMLVSEPESEGSYALRVKGEGENESGLLKAMRNEASVALVTFEEAEPNRYPKTGYAAELEEIIGVVNSVSPQGGAPLATTLHTILENLRLDGGQGVKAADPFREQTVPCSRQRVILVSAGDHDIPNGCTDLLDVGDLGLTTDLRPAVGMHNWEFYVVCLADGPNPLLPGTAKREKFKDINGGDLPDNFFTADSWRELETAITHVRLRDTSGVASGTATAVAAQTSSGEGAAYQAVFFPPGQTNQTAPPWSGQVHAYFLDRQGNLREDTNSNQRLDLAADRVIEFTGEMIYAHTDADGNGLIDEEERNATALDGMTDIRFLWSTSSWLNELDNVEAVTQRSSYTSVDTKRFIITFVDKNEDMVADADSGEIQDFVLPANTTDTTLNSPDYFYNYLTLYQSASGTLKLDRANPVQSDILTLREENASDFSTFQSALAKRQVDFIRGQDVGNATEEGDAPRSRMHDGKTWRLGDIVFSSPIVVGKPAKNYHLIYNDTTYEAFLKKYLNRRQVVYVGANDGMLHAFNGGFWNSRTRTFDKERDGLTKFPLGSELWAYVPYNLLPHLKWLMHPKYGDTLHVAYLDLTPKVFDARIFFMSDGVTSVDEGKYPGGWGTILVAGMRLGGATMEVDIDKTDGNAFNKDIDRTVSSAYVILDVTDPESPPNVLAEISLPGQGFTTSVPAVMPMSSPDAKSADENRWYMVFGSGPADAAGHADRSKLAVGTSDLPGKLFVLDLNALFMEKTVKTVDSDGFISSKLKPFAFAEDRSFISDPICMDLDIGGKSKAGKFKTDLVYFGTVGGDQTAATGSVHRLQTGNAAPLDWATSTLIDAAGPVSAAPSATVDEANRLWIFFGTGRFMSRTDIPQSSPMRFYGLREPEVNGVKSWDTIPAHNLFDSNKIAVTKGTCGDAEFTANCVAIIQMSGDSNSTRDWAWLTSTMDSAAGWKHTFTEATERVLSPAAVLGGSVVFTSYLPSSEVCSAEGSSRLWALYYKTGTPYFWPSLDKPNGNFPSFIELGPGLSATPTLHIGENPTTTAIAQSNTGDLTDIEIDTPLPFKSGALFWRKNTD